MANDLTRAEFWRSFILDNCQYPAPNRLRAQLDAARFEEFCDCGCNSFAVRLPQDSGLPGLVPPRPHGGLIFETDFTLATGQSLEVLLFADSEGRLNYVEIDCNANTEPVPDEIEVGPPDRVHASAPWLADDAPTAA